MRWMRRATGGPHGMLRTRVPTAAQRAGKDFGDLIDELETQLKARKVTGLSSCGASARDPLESDEHR